MTFKKSKPQEFQHFRNSLPCKQNSSSMPSVNKLGLINMGSTLAILSTGVVLWMVAKSTSHHRSETLASDQSPVIPIKPWKKPNRRMISSGAKWISPIHSMRSMAKKLFLLGARPQNAGCPLASLQTNLKKAPSPKKCVSQNTGDEIHADRHRWGFMTPFWAKPPAKWILCFVPEFSFGLPLNGSPLILRDQRPNASPSEEKRAAFLSLWTAPLATETKTRT